MYLIELLVLGEPRAKQSFRYARGGRGYTAPAVKAWQELVGWVAKRDYVGEILTAPLSVLLEFTVSLDRADADNLAKCVLDGLEGVIFRNDKQIVDLRVTKRVGEPAGVKITIREMSDVQRNNT